MSNDQPGVIASVIASHTPRMAYEDKAWDFTLGLIEGLKEMGEELRALKPDLFVVNTTHWITTFDWVITAHDIHEGVCISEEAPHLIPGIPYKRTGDRAYAAALNETLKTNDIPSYETDTPHFHWDYGSLVPIQYLDPDNEYPVVLTPTCYASKLDENIKVGHLIDETAKAQGKRVILVVSNALTHDVVRGPAEWPTEENMALDHRFIDMITAANVEEAVNWLPEYARTAKCEMGGRGLGVFLGAAEALQEDSPELTGKQYGPYAQSSASGNANLMLRAA
jgi:3,4-dihydroxyphenylacetate 2,3-dioxygenase